MKPKQELELFLEQDAINMLSGIAPSAQPLWGTMNVHQMIEHLALVFKTCNGKLAVPLLYDEEKSSRIKMIALMTDKPLQRNFNNPVLTEEYKKLRNNDIPAALEELKREIAAFKAYFSAAAPLADLPRHTIFGALNYEEWLWFHYKHIRHHTEQFGSWPE